MIVMSQWQTVEVYVILAKSRVTFPFIFFSVTIAKSITCDRLQTKFCVLLNNHQVSCLVNGVLAKFIQVFIFGKWNILTVVHRHRWLYSHWMSCQVFILHYRRFKIFIIFLPYSIISLVPYGEKKFDKVNLSFMFLGFGGDQMVDFSCKV